MPRRRRPLRWYDTDDGPTPDCPQCLALLWSPMFSEAVHSVSIERPGSPADLAKQAIDSYHAAGHVNG